MIPFIKSLFVECINFNPLDAQCWGLDIGKDVQTQADAMEMSAILIQESDNQKDNKYFIDSARLLVQAAIEVLIEVKGDKFTLRILSWHAPIKRILRTC